MADIEIYGAVRSMTGEGKSAYAEQIYDEALGKFQDQINANAESSLQEITQQEFNQIFN